MEYEVVNLDDLSRGIIKINGKICFVNNTLPGEIINIKILKEKRKYYEGEALQIIKRSPDRIEAKCPYYALCGGCNLQHVSLKYEEKYKIKKVENILKKFAGKDIIINEIVSDNEYNYRNKITLTVREGLLGLLANHTHEFINIDYCNLVLPKINEVIHKLKTIVKEESNIDKIMIRVSNDQKEVMLKVDGKVRNVNNFNEICTSLIINDKVIKNKYLTSSILNKKFYVSSDSFFQINYECVNSLYKQITNFIKKHKSSNVLDLYCGVGTIGICISEYVDKVVGIEVVEEAVKAANENKKLNNVDNITFMSGKVEDIISKYDKKFDTIIVDPPRSGLFKTVPEVLNKSLANTIIYVSCDPITLARDIKFLDNYELKEVLLFNMFPRTFHCESVCILEKK